MDRTHYKGKFLPLPLGQHRHRSTSKYKPHQGKQEAARRVARGW